MQISDVQENVPFSRDIYMGVENFYPVAVNPTMKELNAMGIPATVEPEYFGKTKRTFNGVEKEYDYFSVRVFLDNKDPITPIKTQVQYTIVKENHLSSTGKYKVLNKYGSSTWLEDSVIGKSLPSNMAWYIDEDVKKAYRGEDNLIDFIKALRNLPNINKSTNVADRSKGEAMLTQTDLDNMFKGNFNDIRKIILDGTNASKVGFLLGVRLVDGNAKQALFSRLPLKAYVRATNNTSYLVEQVKDAQDNGAMSDTIFDLADTKLKVYNTDDQVKPDDSDDYIPVLEEDENDDDLPF